jgi:geranylgeranylglycerol-phosphate geranylgeranyltransferase
MTSRIAGFVRLIRPINCLMMGFAVIVGAALASRATLVQQVQNLVLGFSTGFFLTGASMVINDYYDREIDAVNEPTRPIPSGSVSPSEALAFASGLTLVGFLTAAITNWQSFVVAIAAWVIFALYTTKGKRMGFLGNLMVSTCIVVPFVYGGFVVGEGLYPTTSVFVAIAFLSNSGREVTKGIVDVQGDRENRVRTIAVVYGEQKAAALATVLYLSAVSFTPLPWLWGVVTFWYLPFVLLTDMGLILASVLLVMSSSRENARRIKNRNLVWFFTGLIAFIAGA